MNKMKISSIGQLIFLFLIIVVTIITFVNNHNSVAASSLKVTFTGEYRIADGQWYKITPESQIPSLQGDVILKGVFEAITPDGENIGNLKNGWIVFFNLDHIGGEMYIGGECVHIFDSENPEIGAFTCGENISAYMITGAEIDGIEIVLRNPHKFGNGNAVNTFLNSLSLYSPEAEKQLSSLGNDERASGLIIIILSFIICGIALFSTLLHIPYSKILWQTAAVLCFAGAYTVMSAPYTILWSNHTLFNTYSVQLFGFMYIFFIECVIAEMISGKRKKICGMAIAFMSTAFCVLLVLSFTGVILPYDVCGYSAPFIAATSVIMIVCCGSEFKKTAALRKIILAGAVLVLTAFVVDMFGMAVGLWQGSTASRIVFALVFVSALIYALRFIPKSLLAAIREKELQQELQESRIAIMMSQIQPHFLYNVLNTIYHLCGKDDNTAKTAINDFSDYLRNNLDSLEQKALVPFRTEFNHIKTYLDLEKVRFDEELEIIYDIKETNFFLPVMTVQPLAENAVKHGISKKRGGGTLTVSTEEKADCYVITVTDTGNGFDMENYINDGKSHIGIENVRQRLKNMCGGTLTVKSEIGVGTKAVVTIPKKES